MSQTLFEDTSGHAFDNTDVEVTLLNEVNAEPHTSEAAGLSDWFTVNIYVYLRKAGTRYRSSFEEVIRQVDEYIALMDAVGKNILGAAFGNGLSRIIVSYLYTTDCIYVNIRDMSWVSNL